MSAVPKPAAAASEAELARATGVLHEVFGHPGFRAEQGQIVTHLAGGGDALVLMPTGGGKSLCYQVPSLLREGTGVVVSPLIALMQDQVAALRQLGLRAAYLNSTLQLSEAREVEARFRAGQLDLLYIAPERLANGACLEMLAAGRIALFAIDEAHCVSQWGHDFRPDYLQLSVLHERFPSVPRVALTATADPQTREEIIRRLGLEGARVFVSSFDRPNIRYAIVDKADARAQLLRFIREEHRDQAGIVYCLSRRKVEETAAWLAAQGVPALPYHAGMEAGLRSAHQQRFQGDEPIVMVATIAFGMGIDKPDVRFVAHLDLPRSIEGYYQETGRAGRDGQAADAWMTYGLADVVQQRRLIDSSESDEAFKRLSTAKLDALLGLCETATCRRVRLLEYFGEDSQPCGNCDNCIDPPETWDATEVARKALSCIYRTGQRFGVAHLVDVLRGKDGPKIQAWQHQALGVFGVGAELDEDQWRGVFRQLVALGLVWVDHEAHGALRLAESARPVLRGEQPLHLRRTRRARRLSRGGRGAALAAAPPGSAAAELITRLKAWRTNEAREQSLPAYVILHDSTLNELAQRRPTSMDDLTEVPGIGAGKLARYGQSLLHLLRGD